MANDTTDRDETRRLLYMGLFAADTKRYNLAGTLVNALRHHQGVKDADLEQKVIHLVSGVVGPAGEEAAQWARNLIDIISAEVTDP